MNDAAPKEESNRERLVTCWRLPVLGHVMVAGVVCEPELMSSEPRCAASDRSVMWTPFTTKCLQRRWAAQLGSSRRVGSDTRRTTKKADNQLVRSCQLRDMSVVT
ncbi:hypothetical protein BLNAU_8124 [Blattamonas nauphoetae]|uniref:Uncharacterized protein n=1 Tax=Blattamonas nauphoetae TaxID=2049346 RepID=A0ABQ9XZE0_9EUKA|nr:hypothetical protein BLNAU_8124 [Blattamonas nauphoetae]